MTNVAWTPQLHQFFHDKKAVGLVFSNMDTLFGAVVKTGKAVISSEAERDPRSSGTPRGTPESAPSSGSPLYLGMPTPLP